MMASRSNEPFCFFCGPQYQTSPQKGRSPEISYSKFRKKDKISLKKSSSRQSFSQNLMSSPPSPNFISNRSTQPTFLTFKPHYAVPQPLSPKPAIRFSWNVDLDQTKKKDLVEQLPQQQITDQEQLFKTKPLHKAAKRLSGLNLIEKASLISIPDTTPKAAKVQQSVIMIDYFHPTSQQMLSLQKLISEKQK